MRLGLGVWLCVCLFLGGCVLGNDSFYSGDETAVALAVDGDRLFVYLASCDGEMYEEIYVYYLYGDERVYRDDDVVARVCCTFR